ncbi:unnamed protein product [Blepharisma stoltei]|uniref:Uncharacterized protein n=1 Tax=Blepharisma stoltei TaxID=1481888 RepID=A0AAU9IWB3_9CILI|nr:unnamed protein product [Blepharisma stoltei]
MQGSKLPTQEYQTLGSVLRKLKQEAPSSVHSSCSSSIASSKALREETYEQLHDLYTLFDAGRISRSQYVEDLKEDFSVNITPAFNKVLDDNNRSYHSVLKSLGYSSRKIIPNNIDYYNNPHVGKTFRSTDLTTVHETNTTPFQQELYGKIGRYVNGEVTKDEFGTFLREKGVPITDEVQRVMRESEVKNGASYQRLGKAISNALRSQSASANLNHPLNQPPSINPTTKGVRRRANKELLKQELDTVVTGVVLNHRKKVEPQVKNNGNPLTWESPPEEKNIARIKHSQQLSHTDIFTWG